MKDLANASSRCSILPGAALQAVEIVFIRHTARPRRSTRRHSSTAAETGGTLVSTALEDARVARTASRPAEWNIYARAGSDGDDAAGRQEAAACALLGTILPACQYYAYIEVGRGPAAACRLPARQHLWRAYEVRRRTAGDEEGGRPGGNFPRVPRAFAKRGVTAGQTWTSSPLARPDRCSPGRLGFRLPDGIHDACEAIAATILGSTVIRTGSR